MASIVNTQPLLAALNEWGSEMMAMKCVTQQCADLGTPDDFKNLPFATDIHWTKGAKAKNIVTTGGYKRHYDDVFESMIEMTFAQRDKATLDLAVSTLASDYVLMLYQLSRVAIDQGAKRDYLIVGPCFVEHYVDYKQVGHDVKLTIHVQPCPSAYAGLTSGDATTLAALTIPPATTLAAADGAFAAYSYGTIFQK